MKLVTLTKKEVESIMKAYVEEEVEEDVVLASVTSAKIGQIYSLFRNPAREKITIMVPDDEDTDLPKAEVVVVGFGGWDEFE